MKTAIAATVMVAAMAMSGTANAQTVNIGNTGVGTYTVNGNAAAVVTNPVWSSNTATSSWISTNSSGTGAPNTVFNYATNFTVTGATGGQSVLNLFLAADDTITSISLSGTSGTRTVYTGSGADGYPTLSSYSLNLGTLVDGANTLTFSVYNNKPGGTVNPTGFRLETAGLTTSAVPEPASWAMMMMGFGGLGGALRSNRRKARLATAAA